MSYTVFDFYTQDELERSALVSLLSDYHFEGFEETEATLKAYVPTEKLTGLDIKELLHQDELLHIKFRSEELEDKNWNEEWEKNFEPVIIAGRVGIRAPFHQPLNTEYELVIEPKMSFGTGHHPTTAAMVELMLAESFKGKRVLDFGSGTGVLAILAEKLGAQSVLAIDHEEWAFNNCLENIERNGCKLVEAQRGSDLERNEEKYDMVLANINRNVILQLYGRWKGFLAENGCIVISGILAQDESDIVAEAARHGMLVRRKTGKEWMAIVFENDRT